jgi:hypothetical protein
MAHARRHHGIYRLKNDDAGGAAHDGRHDVI